ncbi:helix-turn-helix domain-containing protein (plasmid) [Escherichia coli]|uniref:helix-turn-helix domain-containing protein n=1 Tax=Escherichia coli TaxID=562 RepID=UPI0026754C0E|nr:helix-turn-helix domain-containing protein [Escherichia coli]WKU30732.1 helix-turn-helix domain-containing protein [Escherichia coli]
MGSCAAPSAKGDDKFITTDYLQQCLFFHVMGALAEMERELIVERTLAGLAAAREQGRIGGRRPKLTKEQHEQIARLIENGYSRKQLAIIYDIGVSTIYRYHPVEKRQTQSEL